MKPAALLLLAAAATTASAQQTVTYRETVEQSTDRYKVETNHFWDNWFLSAGAGAQVYFGDHDKQVKFGNRLAPALDVSLGKWFTPGIGARLTYSGLQVKGATQKGALTHSTGEDVPGKGGDGYWLEKQKFSMNNLHFDVMFNLSNLFCGYNEKRVWNTTLWTGLGWGRVGSSPREDVVTANFGWLNTWRLCDALLLNLDVHGMITHDNFDGEGGGRFGEGMMSATLGLTYRFKQRGWERAKTIYRYNESELQAMRERMNEMAAENARLRDALAAGDKEEAKVIVKKIAGGTLVTFKINRADLSNEARANLGMLAEVIKQGDASVVYTITGYADKGTGNDEINERLSKARAEAVYDCLVNEFGVSKDQLRLDYKGGVDNMFYDDPRVSRAVITRAE